MSEIYITKKTSGATEQSNRVYTRNVVKFAKDGDRLDTIVYNHYGTLEHFTEILAFNSHLNTILKAGDRVFLLEIKSGATKRENTLW